MGVPAENQKQGFDVIKNIGNVERGTLLFAALTMHPDIQPSQWLLLPLILGVGGSLLAFGSAQGGARTDQRELYIRLSHALDAGHSVGLYRWHCRAFLDQHPLS